MDSDKSVGKLTFYDALSNLLPGIVFLWALPAMGPVRSGVGIGSRLTGGNILIDLIVFLVLSYVLGLVLQFLSDYSTEPLLKKIFWKGHLFSEIFLIAAYRLCTKEELSRHIHAAESILGFQKEDLSVLNDPEVITDEVKEKKAMQVCSAIYHAIDAKTRDSSVGKRAHLQITFYSLLTNLSLSFLVLAVADLVAIPLKYMELTGSTVVLILLSLGLAAVFLVSARVRAENTISGLFWSSVK